MNQDSNGGWPEMTNIFRAFFEVFHKMANLFTLSITEPNLV